MSGFIRWTTWDYLITCVDKCRTFGIKKTKKKWPVLAIHWDRKGKNTTYQKRYKCTCFGKDFNFSKNCDEIKTELPNEIVQYVEKINKFPIKCLHQIEIIQCSVILKLIKMVIFHIEPLENLDFRKFRQSYKSILHSETFQSAETLIIWLYVDQS